MQCNKNLLATICSFTLLATLVICSYGKAVAETIKVGAILAVTGPASFLGGPEVRSLKMLVDEINAEKLLGEHTVELIVKDSGASSEKAVSFAKQLIEEEQVFAIIGPSTSGETFKIKKLCDQNQTILISCGSAELIVNPVAPFVFKTAPSDSLAARKIFMTMQDMGISRIAVLTGNTGFGKAGKQQITEIAPEYGIEIISSEVYDKKATDLSAIVAKIKANPDVQAVVNWSIVPAQSIVAKNIRQVGWDVPLFQSHGFANIKYAKAAGVAAEGIIFPASKLIVADSLPDGEEKDFLMKYKTRYEQKFGEDVSTFGGHSYDAMMILAKAINQVGVDNIKVRSAIENMKGYFGTAGTFNFSPQDHSGLQIDAFTMVTVKDGKFVPYVQ
jgi:branched-chain amino acid transport system substrate-binding protein